MVAIVATAVIFALAHGILAALPALGFFGLLLAWLRLRAESVWPGVIAHSLYNGLGILAFFLTSTS
jgi:membrane protease YdiL (CAAX protease family)